MSVVHGIDSMAWKYAAYVKSWNEGLGCIALHISRPQIGEAVSRGGHNAGHRHRPESITWSRPTPAWQIHQDKRNYHDGETDGFSHHGCRWYACNDDVSLPAKNFFQSKALSPDFNSSKLLHSEKREIVISWKSIKHSCRNLPKYAAQKIIPIAYSTLFGIIAVKSLHL